MSTCNTFVQFLLTDENPSLTMSLMLSKEKYRHLKRGLMVSIGLFVVLALLTYAIGSYFVYYSLVPSKKDRRAAISQAAQNKETWHEKIEQVRKAEERARDIWLKDCEKNTVEVMLTSRDGLKLYGHEFTQPSVSNYWVIAVHGYQSSEQVMQTNARHFYEMGYNVLTISLRAHKPSEGRYIGMGYTDKEDLKEWTNMLVRKHPQAKILYYGVSMGGATVVLAAGSDPVQNVVAVIDDCGYASVWDMFSLELKKRFNLPPFPILSMARIMAIFQAGYDLKKVDVTSYAKNINIPVLFFHTQHDDFVPVEMTESLYEAIPSSDKEKVIFEHGSHAESAFAYPEAYYSKIHDFCKRVFN